MKLQEIIFERVSKLDTTTDLFAFGTLRDPDVIEKITGKKHKMVPATIEGFKAVHTKGNSFPAAIKDDKSTLKGVLVTGLSKDDWKKIEYYENQLYSTEVRDVNVNGKKGKAQIYTINSKKIHPTKLEWHYSDWKKKYKKDWLKKIEEWMKDYK